MRLALVLLIAAAGFGRAESAEKMLSSCKELAEAKLSDRQVASIRKFASGRCWKAFGGVQAMTAIVLAPDKQPVFRVCAPPGNTRTQFIATFVEYVRRNPKKLNDDFLRVARASLQEAFPCPARK